MHAVKEAIRSVRVCEMSATESVPLTITKTERCALTLSAIQGPRMSRECGLCGSLALTIEALRQGDVSPDTDASPESTGLGPRDLLLIAFERCIFCGGLYRT